MRLNNSILEHDPEREWVNYHGIVDYKKLHKLYQNANVGIFASSCENMPNILLETMASGLPVLSSFYGPLPEILGDAGLYFDPEDSESLSEILLELLKSEEYMKQLSLAAYGKACNFSWEQSAKRTFKFLRETQKSYINAKNMFKN